MKLVNGSTSNVQYPINGTCPHCGHTSLFSGYNGLYDVKFGDKHFAGQRQCPNPKCRGQVFTIHNPYEGITLMYPHSLISFDKENIPEKVLSSFEEAVKCHSIECYVAAGIMIRKTLEVMCEDRHATGGNLYQRLNSLATMVIIPQELKEGFHELRLLGNDAAHVESQTFNQVGKQEIEISIEFTKEILKGVYQYESLLSKLRGLKRGSSPTPPAT